MDLRLAGGCRGIPQELSGAHTQLHRERAGIRFLARIIRCGGIVGRRAFLAMEVPRRGGLSGREGFQEMRVAACLVMCTRDFFRKTYCNPAWYPNSPQAEGGWNS